MPAEEALFKGTLLLNAKPWFVQQLGQEVYNRFLNQIPGYDAVYWKSEKILPISQLPVHLFIQTFDFLASLKNGDHQYFRDLAAYAAYADLSTVLKFFLKLGSPAFIAKRIPRIFQRYFQPGSMDLFSLSEGKVVYHMKQTQVWKQTTCVGSEGWVAKALEYSGAKNVHASQPRCIMNGHPHCELEFTWQ